jgi:hypothetical protein
MPGPRSGRADDSSARGSAPPAQARKPFALATTVRLAIGQDQHFPAELDDQFGQIGAVNDAKSRLQYHPAVGLGRAVGGPVSCTPEHRFGGCPS